MTNNFELRFRGSKEANELLDTLSKMLTVKREIGEISEEFQDEINAVKDQLETLREESSK